MTFGKILKQLRESNNYTMDRLIELYNDRFNGKMNKSTLSRYENGLQEPMYTVIVNLAKLFNVTVDYLSGATEEPNSQIGTPYNPKIHDILILGQIAAGLPLYAEGNIEGYTYTDRNGGADYFALKVKGDSMTAAQINDGNLIIVRVQPTVENGEIAIVRVNNEEATVKRFKQEGNIVHLIPQSFNPEHQVQTYNLKDTKIEVIGKVVECRIEF